ncbi:MAG: leucine--tRNA ligase, partial [Methanobacteriota archaeon]
MPAAPELAAIERRAFDRWAAARAHEPKVEPGRPKFFATYPYSYMNGFAHLGHAYTMLRNDVMVRYQRMRGKNVLFPFAFHLTGTPIVAAARRVAEGEPKQLASLTDMGIPRELHARFADPRFWVEYFPPEWRKDVDAFGLMVDWRREFFTTDLNPAYDAFIRWQFGKLLAGRYVEKGAHPVIWCPKDHQPVSDHDRTEGEGETPQEWVVYKMRLIEPLGGLDGAVSLLAATLRPDTVFGQTNVWVDPDHDYVALRVSEETWLTTKGSENDFPLQTKGAVPVAGFTIPGARLVGLHVRTAGNGRVVPVLPARFIRHEKATGIVTSVPSDSPQDLLSLRALQDGSWEAGLAPDLLHEVKQIHTIPVIKTQKYGVESAQKSSEEAKAKDDVDRDRIEEATTLAYNAGFYEGVLAENAGPFAGRSVADVKEELTDWLVSRGEAFRFYWPSGRVVCRCLTQATVKVVTDQWFLKYGDPAWKQAAHACMDTMTFYPPVAKKNFHYVVDWLKDWACAREAGMGTKLPGDERWTVESLSDSTIYMAYYTIAPFVEGGKVRASDLTDAVFDHVFLGRGTAQDAANGSVSPSLLQEMRKEFLYWYPLDFRNSGKDLLQNHLTFLVFNHVAIWKDDPSKWPRGLSVNGWVMVDGEKMSKSRGNFITLRQALDDFGASATRLALAYSGEGLDDPNFEVAFAHGAGRRLVALLESAREAPKETRTTEASVDASFRSVLARILREATDAMDLVNTRTAVKLALFDLPREMQWYLRRCLGVPNAALWRRAVETQVKLLAPIVPHVAEEAWTALGGKGLVIDAAWPEPAAADLRPDAEAAEQYLRSVLEDVRAILKVIHKEPGTIRFLTAPAWKHALYALGVRLAREGRLAKGPGDLIKEAMGDPALKPHAKELPKLAGALAQDLRGASPESLDVRGRSLEETRILSEAAPFLESELRCRVAVLEAETSGH